MKPRLIIVGGSSGMGFGCAFQCLKAGGEVLICSRSEEKLAKAKQRLGEEFPLSSVETKVIDCTKESDVEELFKNQIEAGRYNGLVVTALGRAVHGKFLELETERVEELFKGKFWGPYWCAKYGATRLVDGAGIVFVSGVLNRRPGMNCSPLGSANGAVEGLTRSLALELGPRLRVNCLSPGFCDTERFDHMDPGAKQRMIEATAHSLPLGRVGDSLDIGEALLFLAQNQFTTGVVLDCDGGHQVRQYAYPNAIFSQIKDTLLKE